MEMENSFKRIIKHLISSAFGSDVQRYFYFYFSTWVSIFRYRQIRQTQRDLITLLKKYSYYIVEHRNLQSMKRINEDLCCVSNK